jgi:hypothetical protein
MILATSGIIQSKAASAAATVITTGLSLYINPAIVPPSGTTCYDVNSVNRGTINNSGGVYISNEFGGLFRFNGSNQFIDLNSGLAFSAGSTVQVMLRRSNAGTGYTTFSGVWGNNSSPTLSLYDSLGQQNYYIESQYKGATQVSPPIVNNIPDWYFLTLVNSYNGNTNGGDIILYKNNSSTQSKITGASIVSGTHTGFRIGGDSRSYLNAWFKGDMGVFLYYDRELTFSQIEQNFNALKDRFGL